MITDEEIFELLHESLRLLAAEPELQEEVLLEEVYSIEDMVYSHMALFYRVEKLLSKPALEFYQAVKLHELNAKLIGMKEKKPELYEFEALRNSSEWRHIRSVAANVLRILDAEVKDPSDLFLIEKPEETSLSQFMPDLELLYAQLDRNSPH
jgi:hypothetical protein